VHALPNAVMAWAAIAVQEPAKLGINTFAVAPGENCCTSVCLLLEVTMYLGGIYKACWI
jgi:hypothetical protein